jgi:rubredoxin
MPNEYRCDVCGYRYRPSDHSHLDLSEQPDDFLCPDCQSTKSHFQIEAEPEDAADVEDGTDDPSDPPELAVAPEPAAPPVASRRVYTESSNPNVATLKLLRDEGDLDPQPPYQRYEVWSPAKRSKLIESVLLGLPLPRLYFAENEDDKQEVVDGQQRLQALFRFINDDYALNGLKQLPDLNGKKWSDLEKKLQGRVRQFSLSTVVIQKESDPELRYDLFERLNTGATGLNEQELRNAVYRGPYNDFIYKLADLPDWRALHNLGSRHKRMADAEWVLRFMAFRDQTYLNFPEGSTSGFLNTQMTNNTPTVKADLSKAEQDFKQAISVTRTVFAHRAFRKYSLGDQPGDPIAGWESRRVLALADVQLWGMTRYPKGALVGKADDIYEASLDLLVDPVFSDLVTSNTSGRLRVERRFQLWNQMLDSVMSGTDQGPRSFPKAIKRALWAKDRTCAHCGQEINEFDDAHVDHVVP